MTQPHHEGEPVAWRVKDFADGWILFHSLHMARKEAEGAGNLIEPLYRRPTQQTKEASQELAEGGK